MIAETGIIFSKKKDPARKETKTKRSRRDEAHSSSVAVGLLIHNLLSLLLGLLEPSRKISQ
jgi:hypothetical protein